MVNQGIEKAIKIIHGRLENCGIKWAVVGATNMQLQGMKIESHDLDIVIQHRDLEQVRTLFLDYSASPIKEFKGLSGKVAFEVKAMIGNVEVQFFGGNETDTYVSKLLSGSIISVKLDDIEIPCFTLDAESQSYMETNRDHKANLIKEFLRNRVYNSV